MRGIISYLVLLFSSYFVIDRVLQIKSVTGKKIIYTPLVILSRGLLSGLIVAFSVLAGKLGGPIWGGTFATFPAMFTSTMVITYFSQGAAFSAGTMKSALLSSACVIIYAILVRYTYLPLGMILGTFVSLIFSFVSGFLLYYLVIKKIS